MDRDEAREAVVAAFEELGLLDHVEDHDHSVMTCYRCHTKLEPWESEQWFVAVDALKKDAARVVEDGSIQFHPSRWSQVYLDWLANLKDWCISRQLWWGHRIPMFYCDACGWEDAQRGGRGDVPRVRCARASRGRRAGHLVQRRSCGPSPRSAGRRRAWTRREMQHVLSHPGAVHRARHHGACGWRAWSWRPCTARGRYPSST